MIRNRLAALMGERGLKITRVAKDTGISRNTITSIAQNDSEMIRMETINTLCKYLGVTPCEFYEYEPVDLDFSVYINCIEYKITEESTDVFTTEEVIEIEKIDMEVIMDENRNNQTKSFELSCSLIKTNKFGFTDSWLFDPGIDLKIEFEDVTERDIFVSETYNKINTSFHQDVYNSLIDKLTNEMRTHLLNDRKWPSQNTIAEQIFKKGINQFFFIKNLHSDVFKKF